MGLFLGVKFTLKRFWNIAAWESAAWCCWHFSKSFCQSADHERGQLSTTILDYPAIDTMLQFSRATNSMGQGLYQPFAQVQHGWWLLTCDRVPQNQWNFEGQLPDLPFGKLTWQWKMDLLKMYSLLKMVIFHCHVSLLEGKSTCRNLLVCSTLAWDGEWNIFSLYIPLQNRACRYTLSDHM